MAGEAVGGANGANRLSGNAITEALVFGRRAGLTAAERAKRRSRHAFRTQAAQGALDLVTAKARPSAVNTAAMIAKLQAVMSDDVGPFRTAAKLERALATIGEMTRELGERPVGDSGAFDLRRLEWFDLRNMLFTARLLQRRRARARKAAAPTSVRISPQCRRNGRRTRWSGSMPAASRSPVRRDGASGSAVSALASLKVWRGTERAVGHWERHDVPFEPGQSVLDGLRWIRANRDPSLAIRFSCINANACKECMIELDGRTVYALHRAARAARDDARTPFQQAAGARSRHRGRAAGRAIVEINAPTCLWSVSPSASGRFIHGQRDYGS